MKKKINKHKSAKKHKTSLTGSRKLALFMLIFAGIGGVTLVYRSFAFCGDAEWTGWCPAIVRGLNVKLDVNKDIVNHHQDGEGSLILHDLGNQKRVQPIWQLETGETWQSARFAFAQNPTRQRAACAEIVNVNSADITASVEIALKDNSAAVENSLIGTAIRQGTLEPQKVTTICTEIIEGLPSLATNTDNWSIHIQNQSDGAIGLFRDYILLQAPND